jgi:predicted nucleic acid-binding protein
VNASPLIYLALGGCFDLLRVASATVFVPSAVDGEIRRRGPADPTVQAMDQAPWLQVVPDPLVPPVIQAWDLGAGESAVLTWAQAHPGTEAILDDLAARRCAAALGIPLRGTLGLLLAAKRRGLIPFARPIVERLRQAGMYLADDVMNAALTLVGE